MRLRSSFDAFSTKMVTFTCMSRSSYPTSAIFAAESLIVFKKDFSKA